MGASQSYQWASQYPEVVQAIVPFCGSARCSPHNYVFLAGVKAALQADGEWNGGNYKKPPERGLRAFGRAYCGWVYSQAWFREGYYRKLGFETVEDMLDDWERDHLEWDANDLLAKIWTWQHCDISDNDRYGGDFPKALAAIRARAILIPCTTDLYFPPEDNAIEARYMPHAELRPFDSIWGHAAPSGNRVPEFHRFLDAAIADVMAR
jgi:homoserine O-acetyltransferase